MRSGPRCQSAQNLHLHKSSMQSTFCKFLPKSGKQRLIGLLLAPLVLENDSFAKKVPPLLA